MDTDDFAEFGLEDPGDPVVEKSIDFLNRKTKPFSIGSKSSELFSLWNIIPYGEPADCKAYLLLYLDENYFKFNVLNQGLEFLFSRCKGITKSILIFVGISFEEWKKEWEQVEKEYSQIEATGVKIRIYFNND